MRKINNKGFTLVELIATIVVLTLVIGIASYSITAIINNAKEKDYELLVENIKNGVEEYYIECRYANNSSITCPEVVEYNGYDSYEIKLGDLVKYGYLKGNTDNEASFILINPKDNVNISECEIRYIYDDGDFSFDYDNSTNASCPEVR